MESPAVGNGAEVIESNVKKFGKGVCPVHYEIIEKIGEGGRREVYFANDKKLERRVAIKIRSEKFARHEADLQRFIQEAKAAAGLNQTNRGNKDPLCNSPPS